MATTQEELDKANLGARPKINTANVMAGASPSALNYGGEKQVFINNANNTMPKAANAAQGKVPELGLVAPKSGFMPSLGIVRKPVDNFAQKTIPEPASDVGNVSPQVAMGARPTAMVDTKPAMAEAIQDPSTKQYTAPVSAENVALNTPTDAPTVDTISQQQTTLGARPSMRVESGDNPYSAASIGATKKSEELMNLTDGGVGAGLVARGLANRAKTFADMSNTNDAAQSTVQNSNTNADQADSQATERLAESARQDSANQVDVAGKQIANESTARINNLQKAYMEETSPSKREAIAAQLTALTGKTTDKFTPVMGRDSADNPTYLGAFDNRTGNYLPQAAQTKMASVDKSHAAAIDMLKKDPSLADAFKERFGYLP